MEAASRDAHAPTPETENCEACNGYRYLGKNAKSFALFVKMRVEIEEWWQLRRLMIKASSSLRVGDVGRGCVLRRRGRVVRLAAHAGQWLPGECRKDHCGGLRPNRRGGSVSS